MATITTRYRRLFDIAAAQATATVNVEVGNGKLPIHITDPARP